MTRSTSVPRASAENNLAVWWSWSATAREATECDRAEMTGGPCGR